MIYTTRILPCILLFVTVFSVVTANCDRNTLQKCADFVGFMATRKSVIGGEESLNDLCRFNGNVTTCADDAVLKCPNLKDEEYTTLIQVTSKVDKEVCMNGSRIQQLYKKHESCLSTVNEDSALKCVQEFIVALRILKDATDKDICCSFSETKSCLKELVDSNCGDEAADATIEVASLLSGPLIEPRCKTFNYTICAPTQSSSSLTPAVLLVLLFSFVLLISK